MLYGKAEFMKSATIDLFQPVMLPEMEAAALEVMRSGQIASGPKVAELEKAFGSLAGRDHMVATNDLTSAVTLALHLAGVSAGDGVATIAFSCLQSNSPIARLGAHPVWIDVDPKTMSMSVNDLAAKLKPTVKAVMVYHVAGYPADTVRISALCRDAGIPLIEDCNNAIGAMLDNRHVGVNGEYAVFSFYPNRQINGIDGGMLATPDAAGAARASHLRRFGVDAHTFRDARGEINPESNVPEIGWSAALNNLNAAVALAQFATLASRTERTRTIATRLTAALDGLHGLRVVQPVANSTPAFWGFLVLCEQRDALLAHLNVNGIKSSIFHQRNDFYTGFGTERNVLPGTEMIMAQELALPCGWWLGDSQVENMIDVICQFSTK
jgi:dTDP-4-amino-4,6-dideoxygalactose transaminase